jgi:hypothetical protein
MGDEPTSCRHENEFTDEAGDAIQDEDEVNAMQARQALQSKQEVVPQLKKLTPQEGPDEGTEKEVVVTDVDLVETHTKVDS